MTYCVTVRKMKHGHTGKAHNSEPTGYEEKLYRDHAVYQPYGCIELGKRKGI